MSVIIDRNTRIKQTKQLFIIENTVKLIEKIGINNVTMDNIAYESDYTKRTLYSYFKSKDEILLWIHTDDLTKRWEYQKEQLQLKQNGIEKFKLWAISLFEYCNSNKHTLQIQQYMDYHFVDFKKGHRLRHLSDRCGGAEPDPGFLCGLDRRRMGRHQR